MSQRAEISEKNEFYISKHRYYELKHFCLQYPEWKKRLKEVSYILPVDVGTPKSYTNKTGDPTTKLVEERERYLRNIELLKQVSLDTDGVLGEYILLAVTTGIPYDKLRASTDIPCGRDTYYIFYRKFMWLLDKVRG